MGAQNSMLAFEAQTQGESIIDNKDSSSSSSSSSNDNLLKFHEICGSNVDFELQNSIAKRNDGFCNAIVLTNRPIKENEVVFIRFKQVTSCWRGLLRFGLTCNDPYLNQIDIRNARYVCPDLTNKKGYWAKALTDDIKENDVLYYYLSKSGNIFYGINNSFKGLVFEDANLKFNQNMKLWAIFDIYGNTTSIEIISDPAKSGIIPTIVNTDIDYAMNRLSIGSSSPTASSSSSISSSSTADTVTHQRTTQFQVDSLLHEFRGLHDNDLNQSIIANSLIINTSSHFDVALPLFKLLHHSNDQDCSYQFSTRLFGTSTNFRDNFKIAYRANLNSTNAYVFIDREILMNNSLCVQIIDVDQETQYKNETSLGFGCTNCSPEKLKQSELPNDSYDLLNRNEYWIVNKNILNNASIGDELCLTVDVSGNIEYKVNGKERTKCLFNVDTTQKLYFFFNLSGKTTGIRLIPSCKQSSNSTKTKQNVQLTKTTIHELNKMHLSSKKTPIIKEECLVCLEAPIECVIYSCGHMCMCYNCATKILSNKSSTTKASCPICRFEIKDVIRVYKS